MSSSGLRKYSPESPLEGSYCADCSEEGAKWASLNRGVYLCSDCASIHRQLGRHYSQIKHLTQSEWAANQTAMLKQLVQLGANKIWEHNLHDPQTKSNKGYKAKPKPKDPLDAKEAYIKAKYEQLQYMFKEEDNLDDPSDLNAQLYAAARTNELLTSLRLLAQGARPDWTNPEKSNNCALHVACQNNQPFQVELLSVYGANPAAVNDENRTAEDYAREKGFDCLVDRLVEIRHELSDRLMFYLCRRRPSHKNGTHFIPIPAIQSNREHGGKEKIGKLSEPIFHDLCADLYDEVDRRELETVWAATCGRRVVKPQVAFLPIHPDYSQTRNQGRQKIARFCQNEFFALLSDVLFEIRKREGFDQVANGYSSEITTSDHNDSDFDEPVYDKVASSSSSDVAIVDEETDNEIAQINANKDEIIADLQKKLELANKRIADLSDQNSHFRKRITLQAQELAASRRRESWRGEGRDRGPLPNPPPTSDDPAILTNPTRSRPASKYEHICKGVTTSLKQLLTAVKLKDMDKLPHCSSEISRCLDDLINMFEGNEKDLADKLQQSRSKLCEYCETVSSTTDGDMDEQHSRLFQYAHEIASLVKELLNRENA